MESNPLWLDKYPLTTVFVHVCVDKSVTSNKLTSADENEKITDIFWSLSLRLCQPSLTQHENNSPGEQK